MLDRGMLRICFLVAAAALAMAAPTTSVAGFSTYIALGDSLAFGVGADDSATDISNGDRGYVGSFANTLASRAGGVRPGVSDLAISGETSSSFFQAGGGVEGDGAVVRNTNYGNQILSQNDLFLSTIAAQQKAGNTITNVTIQLGANDLYQVAAIPGFFGLTAAQQQALIVQALGTIQAKDTMILGEIKALIPSARIILMGYYDPYAPFYNDPSNSQYPLAQASHGAIPALNQLIAGLAAASGGVYVDEFSPFVGKEEADTYVDSGNSHPNAAGYAAIGSALAAATVPEPASFGMTLAGATILIVAGRRRRRAC